MTVERVLLIVLLVVLVVFIVGAALMRWWKRRKPFECERCGRKLTRSQKIDLTAVFDTGEGLGAITATYCKRHGRMARHTKERTP